MLTPLERGGAVPAENVLHAIFQMQLALLYLSFLDLLGVRKIRFTGKGVQPFVEVMMLRGELSELLIVVEKPVPELGRISLHSQPPCEGDQAGWVR
jgi:hypothetical protein